MLSNIQLVEQLQLQHHMNATVNPDWVTAGYNWHRAVMVEAVEALDHLGWKWWKKKPEPDMSQFRLELVDIWHFALSIALVQTENDPHNAAYEIRTEIRHPQEQVEMHGRIVGLQHLGPHELLHVLAGAAAFGDFHIGAFMHLLRHAEMSGEDLHKAYVAKNVLNLFRQAHGYQDGTYVKSWDGREDNEVLTEVLDTDPQLTAQELYTRLQTIYQAINPTLEPSS